MKIIDLSIPLEDGVPSDPEGQIPHILYYNHKDTAAEMASRFEGCTAADLNNIGWAVEGVYLCTHSGTHMDAPYHYYPTMNNGERAWTIDEVPLDWFIGRGIKMDFTDKPDGYKLMAKDLEEYFTRVNVWPGQGDIVLLQTGNDKLWGTPEYMLGGAGMSAEATRWLLDRGVRVVGTDGWSWDVPLPLEGKEFARDHDPSIIWEAHRVGKEQAYCHIEKLANLAQLPVAGYTVICLPVNIKAASAGWVRVVAVMDEDCKPPFPAARDNEKGTK